MDIAGALLYLMAPSARSKHYCMRLAPAATAFFATEILESRSQSLQQRNLYALIALAR
jgi:hypothetical protein